MFLFSTFEMTWPVDESPSILTRNLHLSFYSSFKSLLLLSSAKIHSIPQSQSIANTFLTVSVSFPQYSVTTVSSLVFLFYENHLITSILSLFSNLFFFVLQFIKIIWKIKLLFNKSEMSIILSFLIATAGYNGVKSFTYCWVLFTISHL